MVSPRKHRRNVAALGCFLLLLAGLAWLVQSPYFAPGHAPTGPDPEAFQGPDLRASAISDHETGSLPALGPQGDTRTHSTRPQQVPSSPPAKYREIVQRPEIVWAVIDEYGAPKQALKATLWLRLGEQRVSLKVDSGETGQWTIPPQYADPAYGFLGCQSEDPAMQIQLLHQEPGDPLRERSLVRCTRSAGLRFSMHRHVDRASRTAFVLCLEDRKTTRRKYFSARSQKGEVEMYVPPGDYAWTLFLPSSPKLQPTSDLLWPQHLSLRAGVMHSVTILEPSWGTEWAVLNINGLWSQWARNQEDALTLVPTGLATAGRDFHWTVPVDKNFPLCVPQTKVALKTHGIRMEAVRTRLTVIEGTHPNDWLAWSSPSVDLQPRPKDPRRLELGSLASTGRLTQIEHLDLGKLSFPGVDQPWVRSALSRASVELPYPGQYVVTSTFDAGSWHRAQLYLSWDPERDVLQVEDDLELCVMRGADTSYKRAVLRHAPDLRWTFESQDTPYREVTVDLKVRHGENLELPYAKDSANRSGRLHWANRGGEGVLGLGALTLDASRIDLTLEVLPRRMQIHCVDLRGRPVPHAMVQGVADWKEGVQVGHADIAGRIDLFVFGDEPIFLSPGPAPFSRQVRIDPTAEGTVYLVRVPTHEARLWAGRSRKRNRPIYRGSDERFTATLFGWFDHRGSDDWVPDPLVEGEVGSDGRFEATALLPGTYRLEITTEDRSNRAEPRTKTLPFRIGLDEEWVEVKLKL